MNNRQLFQQHLAPTSPAPLAIEISSASGSYLYAPDGKAYLDIIGGISVCNVGHCHPNVVAAVKQQAEQYLHIMVYGELVQAPQVQYAKLITAHMPQGLDCVYFTNSGTEATEGALKLARRATGRTEVICCNNSYHGHTMGALSVMGDEYWRNAFRPLLPGVWHYNYNSNELIDAVNGNTACVIIETIQAEAGIIEPHQDWIKRLREKCTATGTLLIMDEIQTGFGRTGKLWGFEHYNVVPDIILLGKALGAGMPLGAFVASRTLMTCLSSEPVLGHLTTFGGHPVCCAAGMAGMHTLLKEQIVEAVEAKGAMFQQRLTHSTIKAIRRKGLLMAIELDSNDAVITVLQKCLAKGLFSDWFLFAANCIRIAPPLTISDAEIETACNILLECL